MISDDFIEVVRLKLQTDIQALLTSGVIIEAVVGQEYREQDEAFPSIVLDITTGLSPSRYIGSPDNDLIHFDIYCLAIEPNKLSDIKLCIDGKKRSGKGLTEYLATKVNNYLKSYRIADNVVMSKSDLLLNPSLGELREDLYSSVVQFEFIV